MKRAFYAFVAIVALCAISSCENATPQNNEPLENSVSLEEGCDLDVYNGERLGFQYRCQFATRVDIAISDCNDNLLQAKSWQLEPFPSGGEPGYKVFIFNIDVADYRGKATFTMTYEDLKCPGEAPRNKLIVEEMEIGDRGAVTIKELKITRTYEETVHFSAVVGDADMLAFTWTPTSEYVEQSVEEVFEKGWCENMQEYGMVWGGGFENPKTYNQMVDKLTPDTEYVLQLAAKNDFSVATKQITFRTKAPEPPTPDVEFKSLDVVSVTDSSITLAAEIANAQHLWYHICEGEVCECEFELIMATRQRVWFEDESQSSFENPVTVTFEIKNLRPSTTYHIHVEANARYSYQNRSLVVTTAPAEP